MVQLTLFRQEYKVFPVPFNFTFSAIPVVSFSVDDNSYVGTSKYYQQCFTVRTITTSGFTFVVDCPTSGTLMQIFNLNWIAMVPR